LVSKSRNGFSGHGHPACVDVVVVSGRQESKYAGEFDRIRLYHVLLKRLRTATIRSRTHRACIQREYGGSARRQVDRMGKPVKLLIRKRERGNWGHLTKRRFMYIYRESM